MTEFVKINCLPDDHRILKRMVHEKQLRVDAHEKEGAWEVTMAEIIHDILHERDELLKRLHQSELDVDKLLDIVDDLRAKK
jgi:hypothetical protein